MSSTCMLQRMTSWVSRAGGFALLLGAPVLFGFAGAPQASASSESSCSSNVVGAPFSYKAVGGKQLSGSQYRVLVINEPCSAARTWVAKLTHSSPGTSTPDGANKISGGPTGWTCEGKGYTYTTHKPPTISGECYQGKLINPTKYFYWATSVN